MTTSWQRVRSWLPVWGYRVDFKISLRKKLIGMSHWSDRELEALCFGIPPTTYSDRSVLEKERNKMRREIADAINSGALQAQAGSGNAVYGGQWQVERVCAVRWAIGRYLKFPEWLARHAHKEIWERQDAERRAAGRYTLGEAATVIADNAGERKKLMQERLLAAAKTGELAVYRPGEKARYRYVSNKLPRWFYEEAYWNDLNAWLDMNEPRISWRLPNPAPSPRSDTNKVEHIAPIRETQQTEHWISAVQVEAAKRWKTLRSGGANPTKFSLKDDLAHWSKSADIKTKTGINPSGEYIYKFALRPWTPPVDLNGRKVRKVRKIRKT